MKNSNIYKLDIVILLIITALLFITTKGVIPSMYFVSASILVAFYFFPLKLFLVKNEKHEMVSNILINASISVGIVLYYSEQDYLKLIFLLLNFGFIMYYAFAIFNKTPNKYSRLLILSHFLIILFMQ
jgi:hypothetical protein